MCKHKPKKLREFELILKANGYHEIRSRGSHFIYGNGKNQITVNKDLNKMVQLRLIKENNLVEVKWEKMRIAYQIRYARMYKKVRDNEFNTDNHGALLEMSYVLIEVFGLTDKQVQEIERNDGLTNADLEA